jgi:hypothetical protein
MSVTEICFEVGYNSLGTFIRRFTDLVGLSPRRLRSLAQTAPDGVLQALQRSPNGSHHRTVVGRVTGPPELRGPVFVGLFSTPLPQGPPVACAAMSVPGPYRIAQTPNGRFFLFAAGLSGSKDRRDYYTYESALRGGGQPIWVSDGVVHGSTDVALHPPSPLDPPILIALPSLIGRSTRKETEGASALLAPTAARLGEAPLE